MDTAPALPMQGENSLGKCDMGNRPDEKKVKEIILKLFSVSINIAWYSFAFRSSTFYGFLGFVEKFSNASLKGFLLGCLYYFLLCWIGGCFAGSANAVIVEILFALICGIDAIRGKESKEWETKAFESFLAFSLLTSVALFAFILLIHMIGVADIDWFWMSSR